MRRGPELTAAPPADGGRLDASDVLAWGMPRLRDLPWRRTRDPWVVLVSEVMLQQTQVARVIPKLAAFVERFPTPHQCAGAPLSDVLRLWSGLGYPRRARNLHAAAGAIDRRGSFPDSLDALLALPGVGPYTARAVLAFAFEADAAVVDTNIARLLARVAGRTLTQRDVQAAADAALPGGQAWAWNQCLMELGALLCRPVPRCAECPARAGCAWHGSGVDPATGSASVSTAQPRFDGSDRQARGRLMAALNAAPVRVDRAAQVMQRDAATAVRLVEALVADGLCVRRGSLVMLPD